MTEAVTASASAAQAPRRGGVLREGYDYDFSRADPATGAHVDPAWCALYETATVADERGALGPMLASRWRPDADGLAWRFAVRDGARFHTGRPCDAEAVADAFRLHANADESPINAFFWKPVAGIDVEAGEVVVRLRHPCAGLPNLLRSWHAAIHNQAERARLGEAYGRDGNVDGTGPFRFRSWVPGESYEVERFDGYGGCLVPFVRNGGPAHLDAIRWTPLLDERSRADALEAGEVDCVQNVSLLDVERLRASSELRVIEFQQSALVYLALDWQASRLGFDDLRVRRAISLAIDRDALVARELRGHGWAQHGPIPSQSGWHEPGVERFNRFDPREAVALLDAAGRTPGADGVRLRFRVRVLEDATVRRAARSLQAMLREVGVVLELEEVAGFEAFYGSLGEHPEAFLSKWFWPDPVDAIVGFVSSWSHAGPNWQRAADAEIDAACTAWQQAPDEDARRAASSRLQLLCAERLPLVPLFAPAAVWAHHRRVHGWRPMPTNLYPLYNDVWIEP